MASKPQQDNELGLLNIHFQPDKDLYCVEVEVRRDGEILRYRKRFKDLDEALDYRDRARADAGLPEAEDRD